MSKKHRGKKNKNRDMNNTHRAMRNKHRVITVIVVIAMAVYMASRLIN